MSTDFRSFITKINDWPRPGIVTYDIAPLFFDRVLFEEMIELLAAPYINKKIDSIVGIEARGFLVASALAYRLGTGVAMIRKKGKLPPPTVSQEYSYEYAAQVIEIGAASLKAGYRIVLVDDILATGGTMAAAVKLVNNFGVHIIGISFVISMDYMAGKDRIKGHDVYSLIQYH